jgi:hypothetical protein
MGDKVTITISTETLFRARVALAWSARDTRNQLEQIREYLSEQSAKDFAARAAAEDSAYRELIEAGTIEG